MQDATDLTDLILAQDNNTVKQFSVSETTTETDTEEGTPVVTRQGLNYKARQHLADAERDLLNFFSYHLGVSRMARREYLLPVLQEICDSWLTKFAKRANRNNA